MCLCQGHSLPQAKTLQKCVSSEVTIEEARALLEPLLKDKSEASGLQSVQLVSSDEFPPCRWVLCLLKHGRNSTQSSHTSEHSEPKILYVTPQRQSSLGLN